MFDDQADDNVQPCHNSVHCEIAKLLLSFGADSQIADSSGKTCLDVARSCPALKDLLTKPIDINAIDIVIPWTSTSKMYKNVLDKVARQQEFEMVDPYPYWYHKHPIASGQFRHVYAGINKKDGREVAIKRIVKEHMERQDTREIKNLTRLADCEQVVRYLFFFENEEFSYVVLELMEGTLDDYLGGAFDASKSTQLCKDVVMGLEYLHELNILHRDLNPGNILYKTHPKLCLKIADFGLSHRMDSTSNEVHDNNARCWIAPEVLTSTNHHSKSSDMFLCGLLLHYTLSVKRHPFSPADCDNKSEWQITHETEANIMNGEMKG
jgi:tRNA A-37 threonylcarbamoyl transferase component Bud32